MTKNDKANYESRLTDLFSKLSEVKTNFLMLQSTLIDEDGYNDEYDEMFDALDCHLYAAKIVAEQISQNFSTIEANE